MFLRRAVSWLRPLALASLFAVTGACGWIVGEAAEQLHRQRALDDHIYKQDIDELWKQVRDIWSAAGCELGDAPQLGETIACESGEKRWLRVDARGGGHQVEIEKEREQTTPEGEKKLVRTRDWELEWKLLERMDYDKAKQIDDEATARGKKAKKAAKELEESIEVQ